MTKTQKKEILEKVNNLLQQAEETEKEVTASIIKTRKEAEKQLEKFMTKEEVIAVREGEKKNSPEDKLNNVKQFEKWKSEQEQVKITKEDLNIIKSDIKKFKKELKPLQQEYESIKQLKEYIQEETFDLVNATKEQKEKYFKLLQSGKVMTEEIYMSIFGKTITGEKTFQAKSKEELEKHLAKNYDKNQKFWVHFKGETLLDVPFEEWEGIESGETKEIIIRTKEDFPFKNIDKNRLLNVLEEQKATNNLLIKTYLKMNDLSQKLYNYNGRIPYYATIENVKKSETKKVKELKVAIIEEWTSLFLNAMQISKELGEYLKQQNPIYYTIPELLEEIREENKNIDKIRKEIEKQEANKTAIQEYEEQKNFKKISPKTQAVVVYEPYSKIFLEGEELYKIFQEQAIVNINFGLTKENEKDVKYKLTQMNYEMSDDDEKVFNTCLSIQYNLENHQYPVDTLIEEDTMYQIYKGDVSFSKTPSGAERKEMKKKLLGIASNQGYMKFSKNYTFLDEEAQVKFEEEGTILPIVYRTIEIKKGGRVYKKKGYCFTRKIPLYMFFKELNQINTAPLEVEAILRNEKMYNEITRVLKKEIAQLYYFQNTKGEPRGFQKSIFYTEEGEILPLNKLAEYKIDYKSKNKKEPFVIYASKSRRTIDSLIKECQIVIEEKGENGKTIKRTLQAGTEKKLEGKKKSRFIEGVIDFLRKAKEIKYNENNYIKDFIMYDEKGNIIDNEDFITQKDKEEFKKNSKGKKPPTKKNPSIYAIDIIITNNNKKKIKQITTKK